MKYNALKINAIKKLTILLTVAILSGCSALESKYNAESYGPWLTVVDQKLPAYELANEITIATDKLTLRQKSNETQSGNLNDRRAIVYSADNKKTHLIIMDEIVGTTDQAIELLKSQTALRGDQHPNIINYESAKYTFGIDQKLNWGYIVMSTYDASSKFSRIRIYLFDPSEANYDRMEKNGGKNIVKELLFLGKS